MLLKRNISTQEALDIGNTLNIDWRMVDINQFRRGLEIELEHGLINENSNVTNDDMLLTGKIALAHLNELNDYYTRLDTIENVKFNVSKKDLASQNKNTALSIIAGFAVGTGLVLFSHYLRKKIKK